VLPGDENLRHAVRAREIDNRRGDVVPLEDVRVDVESPGEVEVALQVVAGLRGQILQIRTLHDRDGETVRAQVIGDSTSSPDEGSARRVGRDQQQESLLAPELGSVDHG
jgi:hypothetical protein